MALYITVDGSRQVNSNDFDKVLVYNGTAACNITINQDNLIGVAVPNSTAVILYQQNSGVVSFVAGTGVTITGTVIPANQGGFLGIIHLGSNTWAYL